MGAMASQSPAYQLFTQPFIRKNQSSASLAFVRGIHRSPVNSAHKWPVTQKMFPLDDVTMDKYHNMIIECRTNYTGEGTNVMKEIILVVVMQSKSTSVMAR